MSKSRPVAIDADAIFTPLTRFSPGRLIIEGNSVREVGSTENVVVPENAERIDASGLVVTPGFIDPHIHGCGGVDVMEGSFETLNAVSRILVRHGTTAFLPTTVSAPPDVLSSAIERLGQSISETFDGATPLGIHLEGPFINATKRGTHRTANILPLDCALLDKWIRSSNHSVRLLTVAPELEGIDALLMMARHFGVAVAMGHSNATYEEATAGADRGISYSVHTFNAMRNFSHRDPGIVGAVLADDRIFAEIIADGIHVAPAVVQTFARAKGRMRVLLATDAISATDMPDGEYRLGGHAVQVTNGICKDSEGRLAGSTLTQEIGLRNFAKWTNWPFEDALLGSTLNPARALKLQNKGTLEPGSDADIAILDNECRVVMTWVQGRLAYNSRSKYGQT